MREKGKSVREGSREERVKGGESAGHGKVYAEAEKEESLWKEGNRKWKNSG